jgi:polyphosphate kinase
MATSSQFRCSVDGLETLARLRSAPLPAGLTSGPLERSFHRDIFLDTSERTLTQRGVVCRLRMQADDRRVLSLIIGGSSDRPPERWDAEVPELDARRALEGTTEPARRLRGLVDPALLRPRIEVETERWSRVASSGWLAKRARMVFLYDACTVRSGGLARTFEELQVRRIAAGGPHLEQVAAELERDHGLRPILVSKAERAAQLAESMASEATARMLASQRAVVLLAYDGAGIAFVKEGDGLVLPLARGSGEETCRHLLRHLFGSGVGELSLLGRTAATTDRAALEVWAVRKIRGRSDGSPTVELEWLTLPEALGKVGTPELRSAETLGALALATRVDLVPDTPVPPPPPRPSAALRPSTGLPAPSAAPAPRPAPARASKRKPRHVDVNAPAEHFLNVELSQLAFHQRVLELAEDPNTPLAERLRYLAIVSSNLDEFFSVRVGALKAAIAAGVTKRSFDGLTPAEQLDAVAARVPALVERQARLTRATIPAIGTAGCRIARWTDLDPPSKAALARYFQSELLPILTPRAVTLSPGHPFPIIPHLALAFAVLVRDIHTGPVHFAYLPIPSRVPRFVTVPGSDRLVLIEDLVRANLQAFYPDRPVEQAWIFRITRGADLDVNEEDAGDLLQAIEEEVRRRPMNAPVRIEIERGAPPLVRDLLLKELKFERRGVAVTLGSADFYEIDGWFDLSRLRELAARLPAEHSYPPTASRQPFSGAPDLFQLIDHGDQLVHHPFDDFATTVARFIDEAARDPAVVTIKMTLYRIGERSPILDSLVEAAKRGKEVAAFVEIKARFDESHNARGVKRLEEAGAQVVYGLVGLKIHAKLALIVRQTAEGLRRYVHIGTGNYNAVTARFYTDLGFFTSDPEITADAVDVFNQLTGSTQAPGGTFRRLLVSPATTLPELLKRIEREVRHVEAGRRGRIRAQVNGLEDPEMIAALYRASGAGVEIDLIVRGLCALRPGVAGLSERIRVKSILGPYLEHQRIFHFENGGSDDYLIGSADWRPRNLRRRVEVLTPVTRRDLKAGLGRILDLLWAEPAAWDLDQDGQYTRTVPVPGQRHVHDLLGGDPVPVVH